jgi:hypothetical protein
LIIAIAIQVLFNLINSYIDAYRILTHKTIAHFINFTAYALLVGGEIYYFNFGFWAAFALCIQAFFNRQNTFDIPLNLRRGLDKFYQTKDPKAIMDKIEYWAFGYNPEGIAKSYILLWALSLIPLIFIK